MLTTKPSINKTQTAAAVIQRNGSIVAVTPAWGGS